PPPPRRCCNKRAPFPSFSSSSPIRLEAASSQVFRGPEETSLVSSPCSPRWGGSGWSYFAPLVARVAAVCNPARPPYAEYWLNPFKAAAVSIAVQGMVAPIHDASELESVVAAQAHEPNGSLIVMPDTFMNEHRSEITSLAARYHLPAVYP